MSFSDGPGVVIFLNLWHEHVALEIKVNQHCRLIMPWSTVSMKIQNNLGFSLFGPKTGSLGNQILSSSSEGLALKYRFGIKLGSDLYLGLQLQEMH